MNNISPKLHYIYLDLSSKKASNNTRLIKYLFQLFYIVFLLQVSSIVLASSAATKLVASDGISNAHFGNDVSMSNGTILIGAYRDNHLGIISGAAYTFVLDEQGNWSEQAKLLPADAAVGDSFGRSVSISGNMALIGAPDSDSSGSDSGAAYIFERDTNGVWSQKVKLVPNDEVENKQFGFSVSLDGDTALIGAAGDDENGFESGSAYLFTRDLSGNWSQQQKLQLIGARVLDYFGYSVAVEGDTAVIGAYGVDGFGLGTGSAYVYKRDTSWVWQPKFVLRPQDPGPDDHFGYSVDISVNTIVIGANYKNEQETASGAAYIFDRDNAGLWNQSEKIIPHPKHARSYGFFGHDVSIDGDTILISQAGSVRYAYIRNAENKWISQGNVSIAGENITTTKSAAVFLNGNSILVGNSIDNAAVSNTGAVYHIDILRVDTDGDQILDGFDNCIDVINAEQEDLDNDNIGDVCDADIDGDGVGNVDDAFPLDSNETIDTDNDGIGDNLDTDDDNDRIPDYTETANGLNPLNPSDAELDKDGDGYSNLTEYLTGTSLSDDADNPGTVPALHYKLDAGEYTGAYGRSISMSGDTILIGAHWANERKGAAYVFTRDGSGLWVKQARLVASDGLRDDMFGSSVSISGNTAVIAAEQAYYNGRLYYGSAYIFERDAMGIWTEQVRLVPEDSSTPYSTVAVEGNIALIGSPGSVFVYEKNSTGEWVRKTSLIGAGSSIGVVSVYSISLNSNTAMIGTRASVYVFARNDVGEWSQQDTIVPPAEIDGEYFGYRISHSVNTAIISAYWSSNNVSRTGLAYIYERDLAGKWVKHERLAVGGLEGGDGFGASVSLSGDIALVGAPGEDDHQYNSGAIYVFQKDSTGSWSKQGKLTANDGENYRGFGYSVAVSNGTAVAGVEYWDAAYVYELNTNDADNDGIFDFSDNCLNVPNYEQIDTDRDEKGDACDEDDDNDGVLDVNDSLPLDPTETRDTDGDNIGNNADNDDDGDGIPDQVEIANGLSVLDASDAANDADSDGYTNLEEYRAGTALRDADDNPGLISSNHYKLFSSDRSLSFGYSVSIYSDTLLVGSDWSNKVHVFIRDSSTSGWTEQAKLEPDDGLKSSGYGKTVSLWGDTAVVGDGGAYVFVRDSAGNWSQQAWLDTGEAYSLKSTSVDIIGDLLLVGASGGEFDRQYHGDVFVFERDTSGSWAQQTIISPGNGVWGGGFGASISQSGNTALIGAPLEDINGEESGAAYIYIRSESGIWSQQAKLTPSDTLANDQFGEHVSISEGLAVVTSRSGGDGAVYVFTRDVNNSWTQQAKLTLDTDGYLGSDVSIVGEYIVVGGWPTQDGGAAYIYSRDTNNNWIRSGKLIANDGSGYFGVSAAFNGTDAVIGAIHDDDLDYGSGAVYVFDNITDDNDQDYIFNISDNCIDTKNIDQINSDDDAFGNACDIDDDNDGVNDIDDAFPLDASEWEDVDLDGIGDNKDSDKDNDGIPDLVEERYGMNPLLSDDASGDLDGDGVSNVDEYVYSYSLVDNNDTPDLNLAMLKKILPGDGEEYDYFGSSVSLDGDTAIIGSQRDDDNGYQSGAAYIFVRNEQGEWQQYSKLLAEDGYDHDLFGTSVAIYGDTALVGASWAKNEGIRSGAVYVYKKNESGVWAQEAKLVPPRANEHASFGSSISLFGNTALIGAYQSDGVNERFTGSAYIYGKDDTGHWVLQQDLQPSDISSGDRFGIDVALYGDTALIGASTKTVLADMPYTGAAYVFVRDSAGLWTEQARLSVTEENLGNFGEKVALTSNTAIIATNHDNVYVYERGINNVWTQTDFFSVKKPEILYESIVNIAIVNDVAVIGSRNESYKYKAKLYKRNDNGNWLFISEVLPRNGFVSRNFGVSVDITEDTIILGDDEDGDNSAASGAAYIVNNYRQDIDNDGVWDIADNCPDKANVEQNNMDNDSAGDACDTDIDGDGVANDDDPDPYDPYEYLDTDKDGIGNNQDEDDDGDGLPDYIEIQSFMDPLNNFDALGDVDGDGYSNISEYLAGTDIGDHREYPGLIQEKYVQLVASDGGENDYFGRNVAISGDTVIVGAPNHLNSDVRTGAVYVYIRDENGEWIQQAKLTASDGQTDDYFGNSLSIDGDIVVVGAPRHDGSANNAGSIYVFARNNSGAWEEITRLVASDGTEYAGFGNSVYIYSNIIITGAPKSFDEAGSMSGSAYIFMRDETGNWFEQQKLTASDGMDSDHFGQSVSLYGDVAVIGAFLDDDAGLDSGSAYIFKRNSQNIWVQKNKLSSSDYKYNQLYGVSVSMYDSHLLIGTLANTVYTYTENESGNWVSEENLIKNESPTSVFGASLSVYENKVLVGDPGDGSRLPNSGSAYMYQRDGHGYLNLLKKIQAPESNVNDYFGSVAISDQYVLVGMQNSDDHFTNSGSAYLYEFEFNDVDEDGFLGLSDNCPEIANIDQLDSDGDKRGDVCDAFPLNINEWQDTDHDGIGNNDDQDDDGDGIPDIEDEKPLDVSMLNDGNNSENQGGGNLSEYTLMFLILIILYRWIKYSIYIAGLHRKYH